MKKEEQYRQALKQISEFGDLGDMNEGLIKVIQGLIDQVVAMAGIAKVTLEGDVDQDSGIAESFPDEVESPSSFPEEIKRQSTSNDDGLGDCPRCGGMLRKRNGKNGSFIGCANFPDCHYTRNVNEETFSSSDRSFNPFVPKNLTNEYKLLEKSLKNGDLNDAQEQDEIFSDLRG